MSLSIASAQPAHTGEWTWVSGSDYFDEYGVYGTKGTPSSANVPGARNYSVSWVDAAGNLWLFGGHGSSETLEGLVERSFGDLWKYDISSNMWTWVSGSNLPDQVGVYGTKGTPSSANTPGARYDSVSWIDAAGDLWLFGGYGKGASSPTPKYLNDMWKYNISSNQWTWVSGSDAPEQTGIYGTKGVPDNANAPGARHSSVSGTGADGNLWLFGGAGYSKYSFGPLNDLWKYNVSSNQWTWTSGSDSTDHFGVYGTKSIPNSANMPGTRQQCEFWTDAAGYLWLFGGTGRTANSGGYLNDLWKYNISSNQWTWVSGSDIPDQTGIYGTKGVPNGANAPGARFFSLSWPDATGDLWLFGGYGRTTSGSGNLPSGNLNDMWKFNISSNQWTWVSGSDDIGQAGVYGTKGVPNGANTPGARFSPVSWTDEASNLWLFGGSAGRYFNDLWKYDPPAPLSRVNVWSLY